MKRSGILVLALVVLGGAVALDAHAESRRLTIELGDQDGDGISISLDGNWIADALADLAADSIDCNEDLDREEREMLLHLRRRGEGSSYTLREDDEVTKAYRRKGNLEFHKFEEGEEPTVVTLPWEMGECMLGNPKPLRKLGDGFRMKVEKAGSVVFEID